MRRRTTIKLIFIALVTVFALLIDLPDSVLAKFKLGDGWFSKSNFHLGLDLQGGTQLRYRIDLTDVPDSDREQIVEGIKNVMEKRVNGLGVSEAVIQASEIAGQQYVIVELPGVKDIQEAVDTVGKTVQLEFKEQKTEYTEAELTGIRARNREKEIIARGILARAKNGEDFATLAKEHSEAGAISEGGETGDVSREEMSAEVADSAFVLADGQVHRDLIVTDTAYVILKTLSHGDRPTSEVTPAEASAHHILIAYKGSSASASVDRTKEEAEKLANELLGRAKAGEDFAALAREFSDDTGSKEQGGDLGTFGQGAMVPEFEEAVFSAKTGDVIGPVETQFGYHVIQANSVTAEGVANETEPVVNTAQIVFKRESEVPLDGWVATNLNGKQFRHAAVQLDQSSYTYLVAIQFNDEGKDLFAKLTRDNLGKPLAIFLDGALISAPTVQSEITSGEAVITGQFTPEEAASLARDMNTGAIPAPVILVGQTNVGASLGANALETGIRAGLIGIAVLMIFMVIYYRLPGLIANIALVIYAILVLMVFKIWPVTLTLAGIAGFILSVGMAVDANVLIFERMREELKSGKTLATSIEEGFARAWSAIRDSNMSSLITCAILWVFGTSIIRGFAVTLSIGILLSMFSAIITTRTILRFFIKPSSTINPALWGVKEEPSDNQKTQ